MGALGNALRRLARPDDHLVTTVPPLSDEELVERANDYAALPPSDYARKHGAILFRPVRVFYEGEWYSLQFNYCTNPFCRWFGEPQRRREHLKYKPHRYRLIGTLEEPRFICNPLRPSENGVSWGCKTTALSNWSIAEEIARLVTNDHVIPVQPDYQFHRDGCSQSQATPFEQPSAFHRRGESTGGSQKWRCKVCGKFTNVLPTRFKKLTYHQQRHEVLHQFAQLLISRVPVRRICEILGIGAQTYYTKLEALYRRCLEFLERHEMQAFAALSLPELWLNSDQFHYDLNTMRKKGEADGRFDVPEDLRFKTRVVVTAGMQTRYVFRADVAYDWTTTLDDVDRDTKLYKDDRLHRFARKHGRFRDHSAAPQPPVNPQDSKAGEEFVKARIEFQRRAQFLDGLHVNATYTALAQYWLLQHQIDVQEWRFVTDDDSSLKSAFMHVFAAEVKEQHAIHFLCQVPTGLSRQDAYGQYAQHRKDLRRWGERYGYHKESLYSLARLQLTDLVKQDPFYKNVIVDGEQHRRLTGHKVEHPLPGIDQGKRLVAPTTDLSDYSSQEIAELLLQIDNHATSAFMQQMRRRLSILERPLVTARKDGRSYIYANSKPKYAQYAVTILRTWYNFCSPFKTADGIEATPAQRLGLSDRVFDLSDIVFFR